MVCNLLAQEGLTDMAPKQIMINDTHTHKISMTFYNSYTKLPDKLPQTLLRQQLKHVPLTSAVYKHRSKGRLALSFSASRNIPKIPHRSIYKHVHTHTLFALNCAELLQQ